MENSLHQTLGISIIVTTRGRVKLVDELLQSIEQAGSVFKGKYEILMIDDSNPTDSEKLKQLCQQYQANYIHGPAKVTQKRNLGGSTAQYPILLFLDSDCRAGPELLIEHEKYYARAKVGAVLGLLKFEGPNSWVWKGIELTAFVMPFDFPLYMKNAPWGPTANFSIRRNLFKEINGFDESFPQKPGGEDVDFGLRLTKGGWDIYCNADATVYHSKDTWSTINQIVPRLYQWGRAECYLMARHPDKVVTTLPRLTLMFLMILLLTIILALVTNHWFYLVVPPVWAIIQLLLQTLLQIRWARRPMKLYFYQLFALVLTIVNELGLVNEILLQRKWRFSMQQMIYTPGQMEGEWHYGGSKIWATLINIPVVFGIAIWLSR